MRSLYETPLPQDWVGFATQLHHQASGGPSYLFGERRMHGWWYYYLVAVGVKVPLTFWILIAARIAIRKRCRIDSFSLDDDLLPLVFLVYMIITALGSSRNYGFRYLLPLAPLAIVWVSAVGRNSHTCSPRAIAFTWCMILVSLAGYVTAVARIHPYELTYFNSLAGGPLGGRRILADSNLDWGQGLKSLARLQRQRPELTNITLYYFGNTEPAYYGVIGASHIINAIDDNCQILSLNSVETRFLAVSASLQWGPWGPRAFFDRLKGLNPVLLTDDTTIAIYRTSDLQQVRSGSGLQPDSGL